MPVIRAVLIVLTLLGGVVFAHMVRWLGVPDRAAFAEAMQRRLCRILLALLGVRVRVSAAGAPAMQPRLVIANHVSWMDVLVLASVEPVCFLAKKEVAGWPLVAGLAQAQGTVFVDRARRRSILTANRAMADRLAADRSVLLFPEGTTLDGTRRGRFHTSHLACLRDLFAQRPALARAAAQPVALAYSDPAAAWIGEATLVPHIWSVLQRPPMVCDVIYGQPLVVARGYDRKALGRALAGAVEASLAAAPTAASDRAGRHLAAGMAGAVLG